MIFIFVLVMVICSLFSVGGVEAQSCGGGGPSCIHFASPAGAGSTCTAGAPCKIGTWLTLLAAADGVLCLNDGVYTGSDSVINPSNDSLSGTSGHPITVCAINEGNVLIDGQNVRAALSLADNNDWWEITGINGRNGSESVFSFGGSSLNVRGGSNNRGRRLVGWNGTSGAANGYVFSLGRGSNNRVIDCAGWGNNSRKIFDGAQHLPDGVDAGWSGFTRCWGEFNDWPNGGSNPTNTYQLGYRTRQQRYENVIGSWNTTGDTGSPEAVLSFFYDCSAASVSMSGSEVLGSIFYLKNGNNVEVNAAVKGFCVSDLLFRDVVGFVDSSFTTFRPFDMLFQSSSDSQENNVCDNCLGVHAGTASRVQANTGWTFNNFHEGNGLAAATEGISAFVLLPGLCTKYVDGVLTSDPLWPWPMNQRIIDARATAGVTSVDVTAQITAFLGTIPTQCTVGGAVAGVRNRLMVY